MKTRQQYIDQECTHSEYYAQFVTESTKRVLMRTIPLASLLASNDPNLNDIPLIRWDNLPTPIGSMKAWGDSVSLAGKVCIYKEAARQIIESARQTA